MSLQPRQALCHPERRHLAKGLCKSCYDARYSRANRVRLNRKSRDWASKNRTKVNDSRLRYRYGITQEDFDRRFEEQGGRCAICRQRPATDVDHNHVTQRVRGLLCGDCNRALGLFKESPESLMSAINYLRGGYMNQPVVKFKKLRPEAVIPAYQTPGASGMDLVACFPDLLDHHLMVDMAMLVPTGLAVEIPQGFEGQVRPRSGLAAKHHVTVLNTPGTVDADYRGEVKVLLINYGPDAIHIKNGDRIAQLVIAPVAHAQIEEVQELSDTERGEGGFGSTGK